MSARSFFDTSILVYADDAACPAKQRRSLALIAEHRRAGTGAVSLQVLQEYFVTVTRKLGVDSRIARRKVELLAEFDVASPQVADILAAIDLHRLHHLFFWGHPHHPVRHPGWLRRPFLRKHAGRFTPRRPPHSEPV